MKTSIKQALSAKLKELRTAHNMKQADVAAYIGVHQQTYSMYERGNRLPASDKLYKLASLYGLSTDDLMKLAIKLDDDVFFEALPISADGEAGRKFLDFSRLERYAGLSDREKRLLFYYSQLTPANQDTVDSYIEFIHDRQKR